MSPNMISNKYYCYIAVTSDKIKRCKMTLGIMKIDNTVPTEQKQIQNPKRIVFFLIFLCLKTKRIFKRPSKNIQTVICLSWRARYGKEKHLGLCDLHFDKVKGSGEAGSSWIWKRFLFFKIKRTYVCKKNVRKCSVPFTRSIQQGLKVWYFKKDWNAKLMQHLQTTKCLLAIK